MCVQNSRYSTETHDRICVKVSGFLHFAKDMTRKYWQQIVDTITKFGTKLFAPKDLNFNGFHRPIDKAEDAKGDIVK